MPKVLKWDGDLRDKPRIAITARTALTSRLLARQLMTNAEPFLKVFVYEPSFWVFATSFKVICMPRVRCVLFVYKSEYSVDICFSELFAVGFFVDAPLHPSLLDPNEVFLGDSGLEFLPL